MPLRSKLARLLGVAVCPVVLNFAAACSSSSSEFNPDDLSPALLTVQDFGDQYSSFRLSGDSGGRSGDQIAPVGSSDISDKGRLGAYFDTYEKLDNYPVYFVSSGLEAYDDEQSAKSALPSLHEAFRRLEGSTWNGASVNDVRDVPIFGLGEAFGIDLYLQKPDSKTQSFHQFIVMFREGRLIGSLSAGIFDPSSDLIAEVATWAQTLRERATNLPINHET